MDVIGIAALAGSSPPMLSYEQYRNKINLIHTRIYTIKNGTF
jgi:hypothetical protein